MKETIKLAVALKYEDSGDDAPMVTASGRGQIAEKMIQTAQEEKVPVYEDPSLAQVLASRDINTEIPPQLYQAVAEVIAFVWRLDNKYSGKTGISND